MKKQTTEIVNKTTPSLYERGIDFIDVMNRAKRLKNDEFYTRYEDVEKELSMYDKSIWQDKVVLCNCDDPADTDERRASAIASYFLLNFKKLKLKKLICTHYAGPVDLLNQKQKEYVYTYEFKRNGFREHKNYPSDYDGSFDHPLSLKILNEEADIVCTNPPFSKSIEFWKVLIESGKKFIIISNIRIAIHTKYLPYFKENKVWPGYNRVDNYLNSKKELVRAAGAWFTNISIEDNKRYRNLKIIPLKEIPDKYKRFDDSKVLLIDNCYIPSDYKKPFAVSARSILNGVLEKGYELIDNKEYIPSIEGKTKFSRVLIQKTT